MDKFKGQSVRKGIKVIAIICFIIDIIKLLYITFIVVNKEQMSTLPFLDTAMKKYTTGYIVISSALLIFEIVSFVLILLKKKIGVFMYFIIFVLSIIYSIITKGFSIFYLFNFTFPILMACLIYSDRDLFGFEGNTDPY